jgi:hypothetical protein
MNVLGLVIMLVMQTSPKYWQVAARQVQIWNGDPIQGTVVPIKTFQSEPLISAIARHVRMLSDIPWVQDAWDADTDLGTKVICSWTLTRADYPRYDINGDVSILTGYDFDVSRSQWAPTCYSQIGQAQLLMIPEWADWYSRQ